jgi:hypothetical protein
MARIVYVVARDQPLLRGYLMTKVGARSPEGHPVELKVDERRGERRQQDGPRDPERRRGERRLQPSLDSELRSRGYARVVRSETSQTQVGQRTVEPAIGWRLRSTWRERGARMWRRRVRRVSGILMAIWGSVRQAIGVGLLIALGAGILWLLREPTLTPGAVLRSALWGVVALLVWVMTWPWWRYEAHRRKRRHRQ